MLAVEKKATGPHNRQIVTECVDDVASLPTKVDLHLF